MKIGASVKYTFYDEAVYYIGDTDNLTIQNNYNIIVTGNEMKFDVPEPMKGVSAN